MYSPRLKICTGKPHNDTIFNYVHFCLSETSKVLQHVIIHTYNHEDIQSQKHFYLVGFKSRTGRRAFPQQKVYANPSETSVGTDIKWQLKNLRWHLKKYAEHMNMYEDVLDDITGFLLFDIVQKCYLGSKQLSDESTNTEFLDDCVEACHELIMAIEDSSFYHGIQEESIKARNIFDAFLLPHHKNFASNVDGVSTLDTFKVLDFFQSDVLTKELNSEAKIVTDEPSEKPLTNYFLTSVLPRFESIRDDSGIFVDDSSITSTPSQSSIGAFETIDLNSIPNSPMDASMVIVDTPVIRNKAIDHLKATQCLQKRKQDSSNDMDGSFVLI